MRFGRWILLGGLAAVFCAGAGGQTAKKASAAPVEALLLSDAHFDLFRDPSKAARLVAAPIEEWDGILREADAPDQQEAWTKLQAACHEVAIDAPYALLRSSEGAMIAKAPHAKFAMLSGDILVHNLPCRFRTLFPGKSDDDYKALAVKLERFVIMSLRQSLGNIPLYVALGNNDTACKDDYAMDPDNVFLEGTREAVLGWLPAGVEKKAALASYGHMGDYAVTMAKPMVKTRLIVLNDLFQSWRYKSCNGTPTAAAVDGQIAWLEKELAGAKRRGERVWVMGHIPAGLDSYTTIRQNKRVCEGEAPVMFLSSERLAEVMGRYADVIRLGVFGHSHMDEMRLFGGVEDKVGTRGRCLSRWCRRCLRWLRLSRSSWWQRWIRPRRGWWTSRCMRVRTLRVRGRSGLRRIRTTRRIIRRSFRRRRWTPLIRGFEADRKVERPASVAYLSHVVGGEKALMLKSLWPKYACVMEHHSAAAYKACVCGVGGPQ